MAGAHRGRDRGAASRSHGRRGRDRVAAHPGGGLWTVAPFRVVYVVEEPDSFRFAYGTLPGHPERGEASFAVTRNDDDEVFLRLASFSRPVDPVARLAKPLARRIQRRYTLGYLAALRDAVAR